MTTTEAPVRTPHAGLLRDVVANAALVLVGIIAAVAVFYGAAALDTGPPRDRLVEAFADGTLSYDTYRQLEPVPGFIVAESDSNSTCIMYAIMIGDPSSLFGRGVWSDPYISNCQGLAIAAEGGPTLEFAYYRYWHGASAISKIALSFLTVKSWQIALTVLMAALILLNLVFVWRFSRVFGAGLAVTFLLTTDLLWLGMSPVHAISGGVGLIGTLMTLLAFHRGWRVRWGIVMLSGALYGMVAQMLVPMAFAILAALMAMLPLLRQGSAPRARQVLVGPLVGVLWVAGYAAGLVSRYLWVVLVGPGLDHLRGEVTGTGGFMTTAVLDPFYQVLGLLMKTWFGVGFMQIGLMAFTLILGWSLARGGARGLLTPQALISLSPALLGVIWISVWAGHTNHTFVHVLLAAMLVCVLFASEMGRRVATHATHHTDHAQS